jgi:hypothetical protein
LFAFVAWCWLLRFVGRCGAALSAFAFRGAISISLVERLGSPLFLIDFATPVLCVVFVCLSDSCDLLIANIANC